jgi:DNA-binding NarL/FixJ family response regulator
MIRIVVVDDHPMVREGVRHALARADDIEVVAGAGSVQEAVEVVQETQPDIAVVDLRMPDGGGLAAIRRFREAESDCKCVVFSSFASPGDVSGALKEDVDGYILKESLPDELISALRLVAKGRRFFAPEVLETALDLNDEPLEKLTSRERDVLEALADGLSNKEIAETLYISENTVKTHVSRILAKLEMDHRTEAALYAVSLGMNGNVSSSSGVTD